MREGMGSLDTELGEMEDQKILWLPAQEAGYYDPLLLKTLRYQMWEFSTSNNYPILCRHQFNSILTLTTWS